MLLDKLIKAILFHSAFCLVADIIRYYIKCDTVKNPFKQVQIVFSVQL